MFEPPIRSHVLWAVVFVGFTASWLAAENVISVPPGNSGALTTAMGNIPEGGNIELAGGTYNAPAGGFVAPGNKSFTIRGVGIATLDGQNTRPIFGLINSSAHSIVFENLTFANGRSSQDGVGGGVTLSNARATFRDCDFTGNTSQAPTTGGGAVFAHTGSIVHFVDVDFTSNTARNEGAGLRVGSATAHVHGSTFVGNSTGQPGHRSTAAGGAIHATNAVLRVGTTRFASNRAGFAGAGIFVYGEWSQPRSQVLVTNSTFESNLSQNDAGVVPPSPPVGGAIHTEDNVTFEVRSSRFATNDAAVGGALSSYRSSTEVYDSVFRGNRATGNAPFAGQGGAIAIASEDASGDAANYDSASLVMRDSLLQGRFGAVGTTGNRGGCLVVSGDTHRTYGLNGVLQNGTAASNRAQVTIERTVFYDCDVTAGSGNTAGGAMDLVHVNVSLLDSLVMGSDADAPPGGFGWGGGARVFFNSAATIVSSTFAKNSADYEGGALQVIGGALSIQASQFFGNRNNGTGAASALHLAPGNDEFGSIDTNLTGEVATTVLADLVGTAIVEGDYHNGPINDVKYRANDFDAAAGTNVFSNSLVGSKTLSALNTLTVVRSGAADTQKFVSGALNSTVSAPDLGALIGVPAWRFPAAPPTESAPSTAFLGFAWNGSAATLDGAPLGSSTFGVSPGGAGSHALVVGGGLSRSDAIGLAATPTATLTANPEAIASGNSSTIDWVGGAPLVRAVTIDRGVMIPLAAADSIQVSPAGTRRYTFLVFVEAGSATDDATVYVDEAPPPAIFDDGFETGNVAAWSTTVP